MPDQTEARSFLQKLLRNPPSLPFEPALLPMLFDVTREDSTATIDDLVTLVERSQNLAARVLAIANSAAYGLEFRVSTLHRAISILGFREIRLLAVLAGTASLIKETKLPPDFDVTAHWRHQLKTALVAEALAMELGSPSGACGPSSGEGDRLVMAPDEAYAAGLLHDIGKVFFAAARPDLWAELETILQTDSRKSFEVENVYWGMDHALIGAQVLHSWKLPLLLTEPINWHHAPELATTHGMEARLLAAANLAAHSGLDAEGALAAEAAAYLPEGSDRTALGRAVAQSLAGPAAECLVTLVQ